MTIKNNLPRVLIVEDNQTTQLAYMTMLYGEYIVEAVDNGEHALIHCDRDYDIILVDIWLPGISGIELTHEIRKSTSEKANIPIIGMSVDTNPAIKNNCLKVGMNSFFCKPVFPGLLKKEIKRLLSKKQPKIKVNKYLLGDGYNHLYLNEREAQCSKRLLEGKDAKIIADELNLSFRTVQYYIKNLRRKLSLHKNADLISALLKSDFIKYKDSIK